MAFFYQRGKITSMYNTNWYLGSIISAWVSSCPLASWLSYLTFSRRVTGRIYTLKKVCGRGVCQPSSKLSFLWFKWYLSGELWFIATAMSITYVADRFIPESPRWLISRGLVRFSFIVSPSFSNNWTRKKKLPKSSQNITQMVETNMIHWWCLRSLKFGMQSRWRQRLTGERHTGLCSRLREIGNEWWS